MKYDYGSDEQKIKKMLSTFFDLIVVLMFLSMVYVLLRSILFPEKKVSNLFNSNYSSEEIDRLEDAYNQDRGPAGTPYSY